YQILWNRNGYSLETRKRLPQEPPPAREIVVTAGQRTDVALQLVKGAIVSGTVRDEYGDPVTARLSALPILPAPSGRPPAVTAFPTAARGRYRIGGLLPGDYVVSVHRDRDPLVARTADASGRGLLVSPVDLYYPGVETRSAAARIHVELGDELTGI